MRKPSLVCYAPAPEISVATRSVDRWKWRRQTRPEARTSSCPQARAGSAVSPYAAPPAGGIGGRQLLAAAPLDPPFRARTNALLRLIDAYDFEIDAANTWLRARLAGHTGYRTVQTLPGVGPTLAAVFVAEIGEAGRFADAARLCSWAGLTPRHRESDTKVHRSRITKQGSKLVRWAAIEAVQKTPSGCWLTSTRAGIAERRGRNIATVAVARKLLTLVCYGLPDGHIRALTRPRQAAGGSVSRQGTAPGREVGAGLTPATAARSPF